MSAKLLADHNLGFAGRTALCTCGNTLPAGYLAHIGRLLGVGECGTRTALLEAHASAEVNAGMCGGCDTCGSESALAVCAICGEGYSPCGAYFIAALNEDGTHYEFPFTEGSA